MTTSRHFTLALAFLALFALSACASVPQTQTNREDVVSNNDPIEPVNRVIFDVNDFLDRLLIRPLAELYRAMIPPPLRERVAMVLKNMNEPLILANNLLQADFTSAKTTFSRFMINTTAGVGGIFEVANEYKLYHQNADFGQTLHVWGVGSGPYLVLPLFGPSNIRDAVGLGVDTLMSPWQYVVAYGDTSIEDTFAITNTTASALTRREANIEGMDALRKGSLDFYAQMRSVYRQYRAKQLGEPLTNDSPVFEDYEGNNTPQLSR